MSKNLVMIDLPKKGKRKKQSQKQFLKECERLEKLVLGDGSSFMENVDSVDKIFDKKRQSSPDSGFGPSDGDIEFNERKPAWEDSDDEDISVLEAFQAQGRKRGGFPENTTETYKNVLKRKFEMRVGNPQWAKLKKKRHESGSELDNDEDDAIFKRCGNFIEKKTTVLNKGLLNFKKMANLNKLTQNEGPFINTVQFHPTSTVALVAGSSGKSTIFQVDGKNNPILQILKFEKFPIQCARFSQDGNSFLVGSHKYSYYYVYDMIQGKSIRIPAHHLTGQTNMKKFELSPDGKLIAVVGKFGNIYLLNAKSKEWIDTLKINCEVMDICFTIDGLKLYSFGDNGEIYVWDMNSRLCIHRFNDEGCFKGTTIAISPNNQLLACGSGSGIVNIYQTATALENRNPQPMKTVFNLITPVSSLDFNSTSELLAMSSGDKENAAKLLHFPSLTVFKNFPVVRTSQIGLVKSQAFSPNSGFIAYGNSANSALLYRLKHFGNY